MNENSKGRNPVLPLSYHVPDGEAHVMPDGKVYIYGSYDEREGQYCSDRYRVVSSPDLLNWTIHGESFHSREVAWMHDPNAPKYPGSVDWMHPTPFLQKMIQKLMEEYKGDAAAAQEQESGQKEALLFAPDCIEKNGKYYLYFCGNDDSEGVAVADRPEGPFTQPVRLPCGGIDPAVFTDEDGQSYYYWGQIYARGVKLNEDMVSFREEDVADKLLTEEEHGFHEGSSMRKIGDTYYYVYASVERGRPTTLSYATGKTPLGPFEHRGILIDNQGCDPASWNNHGSIECVNGQWYIFYHRCSRGTEQHRRLCIEPITIREDGTIPEVKMTSQGAGAPFAPGEKIMGYQACELRGSVYIDVDKEWGEKLAHMTAGDEAVFRYVRSEKPYEGICIRARGTGSVEVLLNGEPAGSVQIVDGVQINEKLQAAPGEYELCLRFLQTEELEILELYMI